MTLPKHLSLLLFLTTVFAFAEEDICAREVAKCCKDSIINVLPFPNPNPNNPRSPALVPISASYEAMISTVFLTFTSNLGEIEVEVMNTTTGGYDSVTIDTQFLSATVPITLGSGHYLILFTLPSGQRYKGELDNYSNLFTCVMQGF